VVVGVYGVRATWLHPEWTLDTIGEAKAAAQADFRGSNPTKFSQWTEPGGENYRELLLTLPESTVKRIPTRAEWLDGYFAVYDQNNNFLTNALGWERHQSLEALEEAALRLENKPQSIADPRSRFTGGHFEEPNVLAHIRMNDRTGPNGERVLFLEEIQSDWHQRGRSLGYQSPELQAKATQLRDAADVANNETRAIAEELADKYGLESTFSEPNMVRRTLIEMYLNKDYTPGGTEQLFSDSNRLNQVMGREAEALAAFGQARDAAYSGVPDAPFKKTWHELSLRRMLRHAAENDYDSIAWTTGAQQAKRYDLASHIDELSYWPIDDGYRLEMSRNGNVMETVDVAADQLEDHVGQDVANRIRSGVGEPAPEGIGLTHRTLTGLDLSVGDQGMTGFYDQMLVRYANKYGKRWGSRVESMPLINRYGDTGNVYTGPTYTVQDLRAILQRSREGYEEMSATLETQLASVIDAMEVSSMTFENAMSDNASLALGTKLGGSMEVPKINESVHSMAVTPQMKKSVLEEGQSLFAIAPGGPSPDNREPVPPRQQQGLLELMRSTRR
jgi:hypothetical protein